MKTEQIQDLAILYASEGLNGEQKEIYEGWITSASHHEKQIFSEMVDICCETSMARFESDFPIPERVKTDIFRAIDPTRGEHATVKTVRQDEQEWINLPIKGAKWLELSARKKDGFVMSMIEVAPGSEFPEHDHHGVEMAYILEGDLEADGVTLYAGDFFRADAGTHHGTHYSPSGCRALIVTANENYRHNTMKALSGMQKVLRKMKQFVSR